MQLMCVVRALLGMGAGLWDRREACLGYVDYMVGDSCTRQIIAFPMIRFSDNIATTCGISNLRGIISKYRSIVVLIICLRNIHPSRLCLASLVHKSAMCEDFLLDLKEGFGNGDRTVSTSGIATWSENDVSREKNRWRPLLRRCAIKCVICCVSASMSESMLSTTFCRLPQLPIHAIISPAK